MRGGQWSGNFGEQTIHRWPWWHWSVHAQGLPHWHAHPQLVPIHPAQSCTTSGRRIVECLSLYKNQVSVCCIALLGTDKKFSQQSDFACCRIWDYTRVFLKTLPEVHHCKDVRIWKIQGENFLEHLYCQWKPIFFNPWKMWVLVSRLSVFWNHQVCFQPDRLDLGTHIKCILFRGTLIVTIVTL